MRERIPRACSDVDAAGSFPAPDVRRSHARATASTSRTCAIALELTELTDLMKRRGIQGVPRRGGAAGRARCGAARPERASFTRKEIDDYTRFVAIYGAKGLAYIKVNDRASLPTGCSRRSSSSCPARCSRRFSSAAARRDGDLHLLRRRQGESRQRRARRAAREARPRERLRREGLAAALGRGFPDVRVGRGGTSAGARSTIRSPRPRTGTRTC